MEEIRFVATCMCVSFTGAKLDMRRVRVQNQTQNFMPDLLLFHLLCSQSRKMMFQLDL